MAKSISVKPLFGVKQKAFLEMFFKELNNDVFFFSEDHFSIHDNVVNLVFATVGVTMEFKYELLEGQKEVFELSNTLSLINVNNQYVLFGEVNNRI